MIAANNILSETQNILRAPGIFEGTSTLERNSAILRPVDQEVFAATPWRTGNTGITKKQNYNNSFKMVYRVVYVDQVLLDFQKSPVKKTTETQYLQGGRGACMGRPIPAEVHKEYTIYINKDETPIPLNSVVRVYYNPKDDTVLYYDYEKETCKKIKQNGVIVLFGGIAISIILLFVFSLIIYGEI